MTAGVFQIKTNSKFFNIFFCLSPPVLFLYAYIIFKSNLLNLNIMEHCLCYFQNEKHKYLHKNKTFVR